jgi:hypothetical protein
VISGMCSLTLGSCLIGLSHIPLFSRLGEIVVWGAAPGSASGSYPNDRLITGGEYCSGNHLEGSQLPAYGCAGFLWSTCVLCQGESFASGIEGSPASNIQKSGGVDVTCTTLNKWLGICERDSSFRYYCQPLVDTTLNCTGTYPPFTNQTIY